MPSVSGGTYLWTPTALVSSSILVSPNITSTYSVAYTLNGCTSLPDSATVTVNPIPSVQVDDIAICQGNQDTLIAISSIPGGIYEWFPGGIGTSTLLVSPSVDTTYSVQYSLNGCLSNIDSAFIDVTNTPTVNVNDTVICEGQSVV